MPESQSSRLRSRFLIVYLPNIVFFVVLVIMVILFWVYGFPWQLLPGASILFPWPSRLLMLTVGQILVIFGLLFIVWGTTTLGVGRSQGGEIGKTKTHSNLVITGPYAYIRHPTTLGFILITPGFALTFDFLPLLVSWPIISIILLLLLGYEEFELLRRFGDKYNKYREIVPFILPRGKKTVPE